MEVSKGSILNLWLVQETGAGHLGPDCHCAWTSIRGARQGVSCCCGQITGTPFGRCGQLATTLCRCAALPMSSALAKLTALSATRAFAIATRPARFFIVDA